MRKLNVLYIPPSMPSIDYRPYAESIGAFSLLGWLLPRLARALDVRDLIVLCHSERDRDLAEKSASALGIAVLRTKAETRLDALADVASAIPGAQLASFLPEIAFAPSRLLQRAWEHHVANGNHYTRVQGLPASTGVEIFDSAMLTALGQIRFPGAAPNLTEIVKHLIAIRRDDPDAPPIRAIPYQVTPPDWLDSDFDLVVDTSLDVSRALVTLERLAPEHEFEGLGLWRTAKPSFHPPRFDSPAPPAGTNLVVLYISAWSGYSGAEECLRGLIEGMREEMLAQYAVVGAEGLLARRIRAAGAAVFCPNWDFNKDTEAGHLFACQLLDAVSPAVIHCNSDPGRPLLLAAKARAIPVVTHIRVAEFSRFGEAVEKSDHLIAVSQFVKQRLLAAGVAEARVTVVYDGVDPARFYPGVFDRAAMRSELRLPAHGFIVLLIARLAANKRHDLLLEAARKALSDVPSLHVVFVGQHGNPLLQKQIAQIQRELGIESSLSWLPFQEDIRKVECAADVVILCSDEEPLGTCVLEGMALGLPTIVSDSSGTMELVENGETGLVVRAGDSDSLASAIVTLAKNTEFRSRSGKAARERLERLFSLHSHARSVAEVLRGAASMR